MVITGNNKIKPTYTNFLLLESLLFDQYYNGQIDSDLLISIITTYMDSRTTQILNPTI